MDRGFTGLSNSDPPTMSGRLFAYLMTVFNSNKLEDLSPSSHYMFRLIENLLKSDLLATTHKESLCNIIMNAVQEGKIIIVNIRLTY